MLFKSPQNFVLLVHYLICIKQVGSGLFRFAHYHHLGSLDLERLNFAKNIPHLYLQVNAFYVFYKKN